jgi:hypothetical protein
MKIAILLALSSEDRTRASVVGQPIPYDEAAKIFKAHVAERSMPAGCAAAGLNVIELWTAAGRAKHHKFSLPVRPTEAAAPVNDAEPVVVPVRSASPAPVAAPAAAPASDGDPVAKMAARLEAREEVTPADLAHLTVPQLKALADRYDIAIPGDAKKDDIITLLLADE